MGNPPSPGEAIFPTLIAANGSPFPESFGYFPRGPDFFRKLGHPYPRLDKQKVPFSETSGLMRMLFLNFRWKGEIYHRLTKPYFAF